MSLAPSAPPDVPRAELLGPTAEEWAQMTPAQREAFVSAVYDALQEERLASLEAMSLGDPHQDAVDGIKRTLRGHFGKTGRRIYVGSQLAVIYPGQRSIEPDIIAVTDVEPGPRTSWMVAAEGKGPDLAIEVHHEGDRRKDFVTNVEKYARLGIREYFIYDIGAQRLLGYQLPGAGARAYRRLMPQAGRYASEVLGLDLVLKEGQVRFYAGNAQLFTDEETRHHLETLVNDAQQRAEAQSTRAEDLITRMRAAVLAILQARGLAVDDAQVGAILSCEDPALLQRWLERAVLVTTAGDLFSGP